MRIDNDLSLALYLFLESLGERVPHRYGLDLDFRSSWKGGNRIASSSWIFSSLEV